VDGHSQKDMFGTGTVPAAIVTVVNGCGRDWQLVTVECRFLSAGKAVAVASALVNNLLDGQTAGADVISDATGQASDAVACRPSAAL